MIRLIQININNYWTDNVKLVCYYVAFCLIGLGNSKNGYTSELEIVSNTLQTMQCKTTQWKKHFTHCLTVKWLIWLSYCVIKICTFFHLFLWLIVGWKIPSSSIWTWDSVAANHSKKCSKMLNKKREDKLGTHTVGSTGPVSLPCKPCNITTKLNRRQRMCACLNRPGLLLLISRYH